MITQKVIQVIKCENYKKKQKMIGKTSINKSGGGGSEEIRKSAFLSASPYFLSTHAFRCVGWGAFTVHSVVSGLGD